MEATTGPTQLTSGAASTTEADLDGKAVVVTRATERLGLETARRFAGRRAEVTLADADLDKARVLADYLRHRSGNPAVAAKPLDLADLRSVDTFTQRWRGPLDLLINPIDGKPLPTLQRSAAGFELQFAANYLGPLALAHGLLDALGNSDDARIVSVTSAAHLFAPVQLDDLDFRLLPYDPALAYGQSATALVLFGVAASARWAAHGITANAVIGGPLLTDLQGERRRFPAHSRRTAGEVAEAVVWAATSPSLAGVGGRCFQDHAEALTVASRGADLHGVAEYVLNPESAALLWDRSASLLQRARGRSRRRRRAAG